MADDTLIFDTRLDTSGLSSGLGKIGSVAGTAFKGVAVAVGAASTAIGVLGKQALDSYADYEQLTGGIETLFGAQSMSIDEYAASVGKTVDQVGGEYDRLIEAQNLVMSNADNAYKTAGMSANEYMETVTSFSASLIASMEGDTLGAAEKANQAITDMADNANKMGSNITDIQNAYQGFAKQNYTMLDNLKLGYGGTKEEMARLLEDATAISGIEYDLSSYADVVDAIHVIQTEMGITGTTAKEASETISGSVASMKSAWANLVAGLADENADMSTLMDNFADSAIIAAENIVPRIEEILINIAGLIEYMLPMLLEEAIKIINNTLPAIIKSGVALVNSLVVGIVENLPTLIDTALDLMIQIVDVILENLPMIIKAGLEIIVQLALGIADALPKLIPTIVETVILIVETLIDNIDMLVDAAIAIILALAEGLISALPLLIEKAPEIVIKLLDAIIRNAPKLAEGAMKLVGALAKGLIDNIALLLSKIPSFITTVKNKFIELTSTFDSIGANIITGIWRGISNNWEWLKSKVASVANSLFETAKKVLGIESPSKRFKYIGEMCVAGFEQGAEDLFDADALTKSINASVRTVSANVSVGSGVARGDFNQTININKEINTPDEIARKVRLESRYGLMKGVAFT